MMLKPSFYMSWLLSFLIAAMPLVSRAQNAPVQLRNVIPAVSPSATTAQKAEGRWEHSKDGTSRYIQQDENKQEKVALTIPRSERDELIELFPKT